MYFKLAVGNVRKSLRDYGIYFMTLVFGVCVFYAFNSIAAQQAVLELNESQKDIIQVLSSLIDGVSMFLAVILGFLIVYASRYLIRRRKKEFGNYLTLGMQVSKVSRIIVYETLLVGAISLLIGLLLGVAISQVLLYITTALFTIQLDQLQFVFSLAALLKSVAYFSVIFLITLMFNAISVSRYKLIDLINADRKNENIKLRSLPLSVALFIISLVMIGVAYYFLLDNGLIPLNEQFAAATIIVIAGTLLFFYSLSGFLLRAIQANKKLYFRGINMFTLRQLNSKINTAFISITIVSMALFLAITSTCGGTALSSAFTQNLEDNTRYDATLRVNYHEGIDKTAPLLENGRSWQAEAKANNFDMLTALKADYPAWDSYVLTADQLDVYYSPLSFSELIAQGNLELKNGLPMEYSGSTDIRMVSLSDYNELRSLSGLDPIRFKSDEFLFWCDNEDYKPIYEEFLSKGIPLSVQGNTLIPASDKIETLAMRTAPLAGNGGTIIVPDQFIAPNALLEVSLVNVMYKGDPIATEPLFLTALDNAYPQAASIEDESRAWPFSQVATAKQVTDQASGVTAMIIYLAVYIGFILLVTCAAILALQQLSEAADNISRYHLLEEIGASRKITNKALFVQIAIYFLFPLVVAFCHSLVALNVVVDEASTYGHLHIALPLIITVGAFLVLYIAYFLFTYFASRSMLAQKAGI